ncbi:MAG TPA: SIR2 family protein [Chryseolinea sp.]|nr:SIR2 family protein [Chryseolinea sp.]
MTVKDKQVVQQNEQTHAELDPLREGAFAIATKELKGLLSQSKQAFLIGAGCSKCAGLPLMDELTTKTLESIQNTDKAHAILQGLQTQFTGGKGCTIEDYMSEIVDLISIADRRDHRNAKGKEVPIGDKQYNVSELKDALSTIKLAISKTISDCNLEIKHHQLFVRALHEQLQSGKPGANRIVDYFILNYDTLIEDALSLERIPLADGFSGGMTGWWNPSTFDENFLRARVFKIHGSIDWCSFEDDLLPRRLRNNLKKLSSNDEPVLIWPAATKYRESQRDPYAQLIERMRKILRPNQYEELVLTVMGYSFGDSHINYEIDRALKESEGRLTVIVFTEDEQPKGLIENWIDDPKTKEDVRIYSKNGFCHADKAYESKDDLPWWKFEVLARILGGEL